MTREEAIIQLRLGPGINEDVSEKYNDAVNMAIEALSEKTSTIQEKHQLSEETPTKSTNISTNPSADRPRGYWKHNTTYKNLVFCSECDIAYEAGMTPRNFCPNCGADMRGGEDK